MRLASVAVRGVGLLEILGLDLDRGMRDSEAGDEQITDLSQQRSVF